MAFDSLDDLASDGSERTVARRAVSDARSGELVRQVNAYAEEGNAGGPSSTSFFPLADRDYGVDHDGGSFE